MADGSGSGREFKICPALRLPPPQPRQALYNLHRLQADGDYFADEAEDVSQIVEAVGVVDDATRFVGLEAVVN